MRILSELLAPVLASAILLLPATLSAHESLFSASSTTSGFADTLNSYRASSGLGPVVPDAELTAAAQAHAQDMASHGYFSHKGRDGARADARALRAGCNWSNVGENLGWGQTSESEVLQGWVNSPSHRGVLQGARYTRYGMAQVGTYWVLMLADQC
jgi:uncharacterized protein YkwD